mmetsp:Transcript_7815/g.12148  ORF Transcript_7815/g.12148 Transcript_7815/m.12148 type:complete len:1370 (-) Transcript_7815:134-4243(-)
MGMEPVVIMVTGSKNNIDWHNIRRIIGKTDFIPKILEFDSRKITSKLMKHIKKKYLSNENFTFEKIYRASRACGPLVKWVTSQIQFSEILNAVAPMEAELKSLERKSSVLKDQQEQISALLDSLTAKIKGYSDEYKILISEAARIEDQLKMVKVKVERSVKLLINLSSEKERWEHDSKDYEKQTATLVGDALLASAFLAYIGYFNQGYRERLLSMWIEQLYNYNVETKENLNLIQYLSNPSQKLEWTAHRLPNDTLCFENAIMMTRFNRYPLMIDPSGQAVSFLMDFFNNNKNSKRKMIRTSFLDSAFLKHLESALRFGNALLVEDVENIDPVLNSVLNREIFKSGGRIMITVGAKEIDFSPHFTIFLSTRDPACHFTPDLCSRVTFVNFSATQASLASQCMNKILKSERPDIDRKRSDLLKLQGEFKVQLRKLEDDVLVALNSVKTNILEDDAVMESLETLKKNSNEITQKMRESEEVMETFTEVALMYGTFSQCSARIYFTLEELSTTHFLYQFSLPFFLQIVDDTLDENRNEELSSLSPVDKKDSIKRLDIVTVSLFKTAFMRAGRSLLQKDHAAFALRLAQVYLQSSPDRIDLGEMNFFLKVKDAGFDAEATPNLPSTVPLQRSQLVMLNKLTKLAGFKALLEHMQTNEDIWRKFILGDESTEKVDETMDEKKSKNVGVTSFPSGWEVDTGESQQNLQRHLFQRVVLTKVLRPELLESVTREFIDSVLGAGFCDILSNPSLDSIVLQETHSSTPLLLVTFPGYDASFRVTSLASRLDKKVCMLAMGSPEGFASADAAINLAARRGNWILLTNVHLAPSWLSSLEKRLHRLETHRDFRIFLTMELNPKVPANLVRMSNVVIFEPPRGIKSSMVRIFSSLHKNQVDKAPAERSRLYFLLAWLHSIILERLRYAPVGWTKTFEFSEADYRCATNIVDEWVDKVAQGRLNVKPSQLPWGAIRTSLKTVVYGGRIDNRFDQERLEAFVNKFFSAESYSRAFPLASKLSRDTKKMESIIKIPDFRGFTDFYNWIKDLQELSSPEYLGLPANAKSLLLREQARRLVEVFGRLQITDTESASILSPHERKERRGSITSSHPPWWERVGKLVKYWLKIFPPKIFSLTSGRPAAASALIRCLQREIAMFKSQHEIIFSDLKNADAYFEGKQQASNRTRDVLRVLGTEDKAPRTWNISSRDVNMSASVWMQDLINRIQGINQVAQGFVKDIGQRPIWLGGLCNPEAFVAASRQEVARAEKCAVDSLELKVVISESPASSGSEFTYHGFTLFGAESIENKLVLSEQESQKLPFVHFQWCKKASNQPRVESKSVVLPVYLDSSRKKYLFQLKLHFTGDHDYQIFSERGTCISVWCPPS